MFNRQVQRRNLGPLHFVLLTLLFLQLSLPAFAQTQPQVDLTAKNVLVLHAFESNVPIFELTDRGIRATLDAGGVGIRNQFFEYLDLARNPGPEHRKKMAELMRLRYGHRKIDAIITMYPEALRFLLNEGRTIFPDVPILALYMPAGVALPKTDRRIIQHLAKRDVVGTLEIALRLLTSASRVFVVCGAHELDRKIEDLAQQDFKKWQGRLEFRYLDNIPLEEILATVSSTPPGTIVFILAFTTDVKGRIFTVKEVSKRVSQVSTAPVFGLYDILLGQGIVGGSVLSYERIGTQAGQMTLDILRGAKTPENIPAVLDVPSVPMFDWQQLRRWNLSVDALPKGSIVINRELTFWDFKYYIIGGLAFVLLETALIVFLIVQRRRKKVAEKGLLQKTEELDQFFNVTLDPLCIANTDGYFLRLNPAVERILGYTREELMAKRFLEFVHPDDLQRTREAISTLASQQKVFSFENRYLCKDGTYRWLEWSSAPAGNLIYAAARDVTDRNRMEGEIKKAADEWQSTFDSVQDLVMILDPEFKLVRANAATLSLFKVPSERALGKRCHDLMHGTSEPVETCPLVKMLKTKRHEETELYDEKRDAWFHVSVDPILDDKGQIKRVIHTVKDITERKRAEAEAFQARRELLQLDRLSRMGELTASLAHELNQPLAAILSNAQAGLRFLQSDKINLDELREILHDITQDDQRAGNVIRSLRSMVKREEVERNPMILNDVLNDVIHIFHTESIFRNVHVETEFDGSLPPVLGDKVQLQQVVLNLILNAADAMSHNPPEYRRIILRTGVRDDRARVTVRDFGPGIDHVSLERIFEPFFTTKGAGLGMGLNICRSIMEAHGGRIWAENNPDRGATFFFEIPVTSDQ